MRQRTVALTVAMLSAISAPRALTAQGAWKSIIVGSKPERALQWSMAVDTQRVVREADGSYAVFLRWSQGADSKLAPRTDRIERHRLDCRGRRTTYLAGYLVPVRDGKDSTLVNYSDAEVRSLGFESNAPESEFFDFVCQWAQKAVPGND